MQQRDEQRRWSAWVLLLTRLHGILRYTACPIQEAFASVDKSGLTPLLWLSDARVTALSARPESDNERERLFIDSFFEHLGTTDLEGQLSHIEQHLDRARQTERETAQVAARCSKAYVTTGICAGLCIGLLCL